MAKNEKFSSRDFTGKILNRVTWIEGNEIAFTKNWLDGKDYTDARIMFTSGAANGKNYKIVSHSTVAITTSDWGATVPKKGDSFYIYWDLTTIPAEQFNNSDIIGSQFYQSGLPDTAVFPEGVVGVKLKRCGLDNVLIPPGCTMESDAGIDCCNNRIIKQNDGELWKCDGLNDPIEPVNKKKYLRLKLSLDPADIPAELVSTALTGIEEGKVLTGELMELPKEEILAAMEA